MTTATTSYRLATGVALGAGLFLLWGIGALGIIGAGGPPDLLYLGALAVGVVGALAARLRPRGMALALSATAVATMLAGLVAVAAGLHREEGASVLEILGLSAMYAALFAGSAWLFRRAAEPPRS
jgi:hypothetical protein